MVEHLEENFAPRELLLLLCRSGKVEPRFCQHLDLVQTNLEQGGGVTRVCGRETYSLWCFLKAPGDSVVSSGIGLVLFSHFP